MAKPPRLSAIIASGLGTGYSPFAPGTMGALLSLLIWYVLSLIVPDIILPWITVTLILGGTSTGIWATNQVIPYWGKDPSRVVVDEMVGTWITLLASPAGHIWYAVCAFGLFRLFDIFKPLGIRHMEKLPGGIGVMADDILAGIYGFITLTAMKWMLE